MTFGSFFYGQVLAEERAEQQRLQQATQPPSTAAASEPMDPAAFIQTLPRSLRQSVLSDIDHSMLALLPAELAAEAQALRLECARVIRRRQLLQERRIRETGSKSTADNVYALCFSQTAVL